MHIALNAWFWDRPYTGSGQYLHQLVKALRQIESDLKITLIMPAHIKSPEGVPSGVEVVPVRVPLSGISGQLGKVLFEQQTYPAVVGRVGADIAHVPYWGA